ncbi:MAG: MFS transporter [Tepidisphaeraceae bacterium]
MSSSVSAVNLTPAGVRHQWATRAAFFIAGFSISSWAPLIPFAKGRLNLDDGHLGALLLCLGAGSVTGMPAAGALAGRFGCRAMIVLSALMILCMLPVLATAGHVVVLAGALLLFGAGLGTLDVTMNIHAVLVERESGRSMMSGFHGMYSVGGIAGAGLMSLLMSAGLLPLHAILASCAIGVILLGVSYTSLLSHGSDSDSPGFAFPHGYVLLIGCFCFVMFLAEGSVLDWSAEYLHKFRDVEKAHAGVAYVAFSIAMTTCRLLGDRIVPVIGSRLIVFGGALTAAGGFVLATTVHVPVVTVIGFALVGIGASNVVPVLFSAVGRQTRTPANVAIAGVTTMGYAGILAGPAGVGFIARYFGLSVGLGVIAAMLAAVALVSTRVRV